MVYPPTEATDSSAEKEQRLHWTFIVQFDTIAHAEKWEDSKECKALYKEVAPMTINVDKNIIRMPHTIVPATILGFTRQSLRMTPSLPEPTTSPLHDDAEGLEMAEMGGDNAKEPIVDPAPEPPPHRGPIPWKQGLCVLTCLYPTVLLEGWILWHVFDALGPVPMPVNYLIGTSMSVPVLTFFLIPLYCRHLSWYMVEYHDPKTEATVVGSSLVYFASLCVLTTYTWAPLYR